MGHALNSSGIPRNEFFITTKLHPRDLGYESTKKAVATSLVNFATTYIDLVLLHYPRCFPGVCSQTEIHRTELSGGWQAAWRALEDLLKLGSIRAIGVSNFDLSELEQMDPLPHVVQNWFDPFRQDRTVLEWATRSRVAYTSYSTLGGQWEHQEVDGGRRANPVFVRCAAFPPLNYHISRL